MSRQAFSQFISFSNAIGVRPSELDAVMWFEMMSSPASVGRLLGRRLGSLRSPQFSWTLGPKDRRANANQTALFE